MIDEFDGEWWEGSAGKRTYGTLPHCRVIELEHGWALMEPRLTLLHLLKQHDDWFEECSNYFGE